MRSLTTTRPTPSISWSACACGCGAACWDWTKEGLARLVGVTVQQVKDFEAGAERIGASTLFVLASKLEVPITWFYDGASIESHLPIDMARNSAGRAVLEVTDALKKREGEALLLFYFSEMDAPMRERLVEIARVLADS